MQTKQCSKCEKVKPLDEFYEDDSTDGRYSSCKQCKREYKRQYYAEHRKEENKRTAQWRTDNPGYDAQYNAEHRKENREHNAQWRAKNLNYYKQYRIDNAGKYRAYAANRYALSIAAEGYFTDEQFTKLCEQHDNRCLCCGKVKKLTVDHIVPLSKGGSNDISNIQSICGPCNSKKGTKTIDYRPKQSRYPLRPIQPLLPGLALSE